MTRVSSEGLAECLPAALGAAVHREDARSGFSQWPRCREASQPGEEADSPGSQPGRARSLPRARAEAGRAAGQVPEPRTLSCHRLELSRVRFVTLRVPTEMHTMSVWSIESPEVVT